MSDQLEEYQEGCEHAPPAYPLSRYDIMGLAFLTVGEGIGAVANGFARLSVEFFAAARHQRAVNARKAVSRYYDAQFDGIISQSTGSSDE